MCLILFSWQQHPKYKLVLAANRDEFYQRPTLAAGFWPDDKQLMAGRDLTAGGTWIGMHRSGKFAALTNYRDPHNIDPAAISRGELTTNYLKNEMDPLSYLELLKRSEKKYNGFNLMVGDTDHLHYYNNVNHEIESLTTGSFGLSNGFFQENWPKLKKGRDLLEAKVTENDIEPDTLFDILEDRQRAEDQELPKTGIPIDWERALSSLFIETEEYGTRCSTLIYLDYDNNVRFIEKTHDVGGQTASLNEYEFKLEVKMTQR